MLAVNLTLQPNVLPQTDPPLQQKRISTYKASMGSPWLGSSPNFGVPLISAMATASDFEFAISLSLPSPITKSCPETKWAYSWARGDPQTLGVLV